MELPPAHGITAQTCMIAAKSTSASAPTPAHKNITDRDYFVKTVQIDGRVYDLVANFGKSADSQYVYSIQLRENKKAEVSPPRRMEKPTTLFLVKNTADVVIGFTKAGICELHDVANLTPTKFKYKTRDALSTISHNNEHLQKRSSLADTSIRDTGQKSQAVFEKKISFAAVKNC